MKTKLITLCAISTIITSNVFAKDISAPFMNVAIPKEGLNVRYDFEHNKYPLQLTCVFEKVYKGDLYYTEDKKEKKVDFVFGGGDETGDQFFFSRTNVERGSNDDINAYHVDGIGSVRILSTPHGSIQPYASCFYLPEIVK